MLCQANFLTVFMPYVDVLLPHSNLQGRNYKFAEMLVALHSEIPTH